MGLPFHFPPSERSIWRPLDDEDRVSWLNAARDRFFDKAAPFVPPKIPGRTVALDGTLVDNLLGFYCALGEAVNGPGGYFGLSMQAFDDCLFGGFGLEYPYTIVWHESARSSRALGAAALLTYLDAECDDELDPIDFAEGIAWREATRAAGLAGTRTLFEEIVERVRSVPTRNGGSVTLLLD